jgi:type IV pilus assembly protein PilB
LINQLGENQMLDTRMGEVLCRMGIIQKEDIDRILSQQRRTRQKFGQIAIRLGLVTQEQIWEAWARQLAEREGIDLDAVGSDTPAVETLPLATARRFGVVPLRLWGQNLVVAAPADISGATLEQLARETGCQIHVCVSTSSSIREHLQRLSEAMCAA